MPLPLGCIADDYTGASDLANTLTRAGLRTVQTIGVPRDDLDLPETDAVVVALKSRSIAPEAAVAQALEARRWLAGRGAGHILFKICSTFDSTDRGNIGPVTDALRAVCGGGTVLVTPAFPATGRTVYMGHLFVGTRPLHESPLKDHPLNPMRDPDLVRVLARQSRAGIGLIDRTIVARGAAAIEARLAELAADGIGAAIVDAITEADLEAIGTVAARRLLSVGASGLGFGIARALAVPGREGQGEAALAEVMRPVGGRAAILAGSCSAATLEQLARIGDGLPVTRLEVEAVMADPAAEVARVLSLADAAVQDDPLVIASSAPPERVAALQARHGREAVGQGIERAMAEIAAGLVARGVRRMVVAGGETSGAVVDRLGFLAFLVGPEIAPGVPVLRTAGAGQGAMLMALKSGNFGGPDFFRTALDLMR